MKVCRGHRCVGGFVGSTVMEDHWIDLMVEKWVARSKSLSKVAVKCPQTAYTGFAQSLEAEWQYLCRCVPGIEKHLGPVEEAIHRHVLIPDLLEVEFEEVLAEFWQPLTNGVK